MEHLLELQNLHVSYHTPRGTVQAVRGIDLTLDSGEVLASSENPAAAKARFSRPLCGCFRKTRA